MIGIKRLGLAFAIGAAVAVSGCNDGYGYDGVAVGYGAGYYDPDYGGYAAPYYGYPAGGLGYYGWYGGFYYPGSGGYVYDRYRRPFRWNGDQRRYWQGRFNSYRGGSGLRPGGSGFGRGPNWGGFHRGTGVGTGVGRGTVTGTVTGTGVTAPAGQGFRGAAPGTRGPGGGAGGGRGFGGRGPGGGGGPGGRHR